MERNGTILYTVPNGNWIFNLVQQGRGFWIDWYEDRKFKGAKRIWQTNLDMAIIELEQFAADYPARVEQKR